jgi:hypothetical protein
MSTTDTTSERATTRRPQSAPAYVRELPWWRWQAAMQRRRKP